MPHSFLQVRNRRASATQARLIVTNDVRRTVLPESGGQLSANTAVVEIDPPGGDLDPQPTTLPGQTQVNRVGPTLFILVHGMNHPANSDARVVDTPQQSRKEWHLDFIQGLLGGRDPAGQAHLQMFDFAGQHITQDNFMAPWFTFEGQLVAHPNLQDHGVLPPFDSFTNEADIEDLDAVASHFVTLDKGVGDLRGIGPPFAASAPSLSAFITYRDATAGLVESGRRIANETYVAIRWYELHFRLTPKVVYVGQSFGGLAARFVLSNPTQAQLDARPPGMPPLNPEGIQLTAEDHRRMDYVRDRIVYMVTLGTPHEGSYMADVLLPVQQSLLALENSLDSGVGILQANLQPLGTMLGLLGAVLMPDQTAMERLATMRGVLADIRGMLNGRAFRDLPHPYWVRANTGPLHPSRAHRGSASPIPGGAGQLIPIYAAGARTPGGRAFTTPDIAVLRARMDAENRQEREWMISTVVTDLLIHILRADQGGFGRTDQAIFAGFEAQFDRRERIVDGSAMARSAAASIVNRVSPWFAENFGGGVEGIVNFVMGSARNMALPVYLARKGRFDLGGSVVLPVPAFQCTLADGSPFVIPLRFGQLLASMRDIFGSLTAARNALRNKNLNEVIAALRLVGIDANAIVGWFVQAYLDQQVPAGRCNLKIDPTSPLSAVISTALAAANLRNWRVVEATDTFPAPRWVSTAQLASDGEIDSDGVVSFDSAVGFSLGSTTPIFFDHTHTADVPGFSRGSWYRIFDSPLERECHGMQHQWNIGRWTLRNFDDAGPIPGPDALSVWS